MTLEERLLAGLDAGARRRLAIDEVREIMTRVEPQLVASTELGQMLRSALTSLAEHGLLTLSGRTGRDGLPTCVTLPERPAIARRKSGLELAPVHPALAQARRPVSPGWVANEVEIIERVNSWLVDGGGINAPYVALRERSWAIFDDDRRLEQAKRLFAHGVLTDELLRVVRTPPPFPWIAVGESPAILFVENSATFDSVVRVLESSPQPRYGVVAFAGGQGFASRLPFVTRLPALANREPLEVLHYFGDIDRAGLDIPTAAAGEARKIGLPPLEPAIDLYEALLSRAPSSVKALPGELDGWLPPALERRALDVIASRGSLPQEALDRERLRALLVG